MRIDYDYGSPDMRESIQEEHTPENSSSSSAGNKEEEQGGTTLPLHHHVKSTNDATQTHIPFPSIWSTPTKSASSRAEAQQGENTPATTTSLDNSSLDSSVSPSPQRYTHRQYADEVRLSINFQNLQHLSHGNTEVIKSKAEVVLQTFGPKFVLEVMGGAGAVWGFSEAIGLRTSATVWFWRPVTLFAGALFFTRWYRQLQEFIRLYDRRTKRRSTVEGESAALLLQENV